MARKQRGGAASADASPSVPPTTLEAATPLPDPFTAEPMSGGRKKATKKPAAKKGAKKGGSVLSDVQSLAVPFAILLAKQGLESLKEKKTVKKAAVSARQKSAAGGCGSCASAVPVARGGATPKAAAKSGGVGYAKLSKQIDDFLKNF